MSQTFDVQKAPGHLIRRAHQISVALFMEEAGAFDVTPVQFAILHALMDAPGDDQATLAARVAFDAATIGSVIGRLEAKGWIRRQPDAADRRRKLLWITPEGEAVAHAMNEAATRTQARILEPLAPKERQQFVQMLARLVARDPQA